MTAWTDLVKKVYKEGHAKNPEYSLKDAMLEARKLYKQKPSSTASAAQKKTKRVTRKRRATKRKQ